MKRRCSLAFGPAFFFLGVSAVCMAHGVDGAADQVTGYCITAQYSDGEPMSWSEVRITAPDADIEFQNGRTDRNGRFMFLPDVQGAWNVVVQDGMGHRLALDVAVADEGASVPEQVRDISHVGHGKTNRTANILAGLGIIFGLYGFFYGWKAGRKKMTQNGKDSATTHGSPPS